jgi:broad specificity phosphatase PhoE
MRLIIIRHAETIENAKGMIQGYGRGSLSARGKQQATDAAELLKHEAFDAIFCSDLERCRTTAAYITKYHEQTPFYLTSQLREMNIGNLSKVPVRIPKFAKRSGTALSKLFNLTIFGGESWKALQTRAAGFLNDTFERYPDATVLLVTHGLTMRAIYSVLGEEQTKGIEPNDIPNCTIWRVSMDKLLKR